MDGESAPFHPMPFSGFPGPAADESCSLRIQNQRSYHLGTHLHLDLLIEDKVIVDVKAKEGLSLYNKEKNRFPVLIR